MPSFFGKVTYEIKCTSCGGKGPHETIYTDDSIQHLRCPACTASDVYLIEQPEGTTHSSKAEVMLQDHAALMERRGSQEAPPYSPTKSLAEGEYIEHPTFGVGYIVAVTGPPPRVRIIFSEKKRLLVCGLPLIEDPPEKAPVTPRSPSRATSNATAGKPSNAGGAASASGPVKCPKCGEVVNAFNLHCAPDGTVVGCIRC